MYVGVDELGEAFSMRDDGLKNEEIDVPFEFPIVKDIASDLSLHLRILHLIITWNLRHFGSRHSFVCPLDRFWLHQIHS